MLQKFRSLLKNEKGLTLIELLAVVVILGIIAAIAIPSIGGLIDNSRKDAHVANAQQMANSAKLVIAGDTALSQGTKYITLNYLETQKYLEVIKDPDGSTTTYTKGNNNSKTNILNAEPTTGSYVVVTDGKVTAVKLVNGTRGVQSAGTTSKGPVLVSDLKRDAVIDN